MTGRDVELISTTDPKPAGPPGNPQTPVVHPIRTDLYLKLILVGIIILISLQGYIILSSQPWTLIPSGTRILLAPQSSHAVVFSLSQLSLISGTIYSTDGVLLYLVDSWEYNNATSKDNPTYHILEADTGFVGVFTLGSNLPQGTFRIIFTNNSPQNATVNIIQAITLTPY